MIEGHGYVYLTINVGTIMEAIMRCWNCHTLDPDGSNGYHWLIVGFVGESVGFPFACCVLRQLAV